MANAFSVIAQAGIGYLTGGPAGAAAAGLSAMTGGNASTTAGGIGNAAMQVLGAASQADQFALLATQQKFQSAMNWQAEGFNEMAEQRSETMREGNVLRDIAMAQRKADNAITKEFITMIKE